MRRNKYTFLACFIIFCAVLVRLFLITYNWPTTDSEEGTMGLEALHIAFRGEHPIYLYGQNYMGVREAYLGAVAFHLFGASVFSLRLGMLLLFLFFLIFVYLLGKLLYGEKVACVALLLMVGGAENVLTPEMKAVGGAIETLTFGTLTLLLASWLALNSMKEIPIKAQLLWQRRFAYCGWGLAAGLGLWSHLLVAPFILASAVLLAFFCFHDLRRRNGLFLFFGFSFGIVPLIIYNITSPIADNTFAVFIGLHNTVYPNAPTGVVLWLKQLSGTFLYTLPIATGLPQIISNTVLPFYSGLQLQFLPSILLYGLWSLGYMALLAVSSWQSVKHLYSIWQQHKATKAIELSKKRELALYASQFTLLISGWLTILSYMTSVTSAQRPWSFRYLVGLMIVLPALIAPLVKGQDWSFSVRLKAKGVLVVSLLTIILVVSTVGTLQSFSTLSNGNVLMRQQDELVHTLVNLGVTKIYSGYWVCDRIIFQSREKVICAVVNEKMQPGLTRYTAYKDVVDQSKNVAYVFTKGIDFHPSDYIRRFGDDKRYMQMQTSQYIIFIAKGNSGA